MQAIIASCNENDESDKFSINDSNFSENYFNNRDIKMANFNNTEILYIRSAFDSNSPPDISIMN